MSVSTEHEGSTSLTDFVHLSYSEWLDISSAGQEQLLPGLLVLLLSDSLSLQPRFLHLLNMI